jgi:hypothetical protein
VKAHALARFIELCTDQRGHTREFVRALRSYPANTTAVRVLAAMRASAASGEAASTEKLGDLEGDASRLCEIVGAIGGKGAQQILLDLQELIRAFPSLPIAALQYSPQRRASKAKAPPQADPEVVARHVRSLLSSAPGTEGFGTALANLEADASVKAVEMRDIAVRTGVQVAEASSRPVAFKKLALEHRIIIETRAKAEALRGNNSA